ncbi:MAG: dienelactone hydrolase family protein [Desulfobacterales bacterium]|nr:dienelactone hydrolase family protein [Desulfobacterales bacterium]
MKQRRAEKIAYLNHLCDGLGMDTITTGNFCAFAIEAFRLGRTDHAIAYGDAEGIAEPIRMIADRKGIKKIMAKTAGTDCIRFFISLALSSMLLAGICAAGTNNYDRTFTPAYLMKTRDWSDPSEIKRTWEAAIVCVPDGDSGVYETTMSEIETGKIPAGKKFPTVIYLHGCAGVWIGTYERIDFLARSGFAVIAPVSFARENYPMSCDTRNHKGGLYRGTLTMRQYDAGHAIVSAKTLTWVDPDNVFLMGLSQGGITAATFHSDDPRASVRARVVEGWTCHAGWDEYEGINAPADEPVLTLVAEKDPWFQNPWSKGNCKCFLNQKNGSQSIVYTSEILGRSHELMHDPEVRDTVLHFMRAFIRN